MGGAHCTVWTFKYGILRSLSRFVKESVVYDDSVVPRVQDRWNSSVAQRQTTYRVYTAARFCYIEQAAAACFPSCSSLSQRNNYKHLSYYDRLRWTVTLRGLRCCSAILGMLELEQWCCIILRHFRSYTLKDATSRPSRHKFSRITFTCESE